MKPDELNFYLTSLLLYFDEDDRLKDSTFRKITYVGKKVEAVSYPMLINTLVRSGKIDVSFYTFAKFKRVNSFLAGIDKVGSFMDDE